MRAVFPDAPPESNNEVFSAARNEIALEGAVNEVVACQLLMRSDATPAQVDGISVLVTQQTSYPREGQVRIAVEPHRDLRFTLSLRVPEWAGRAALTLDGAPIRQPVEGGYLHLTRDWPARVSRLELCLDLPVQRVSGASDGGPLTALQRGPLVLALDSRYGDISRARLGPETPALRSLPADDALFPIVMLEDDRGHTFVDYASAGSADPLRDRFRVWLPVGG